MDYVIGVDVGGTKIALGLFDQNRRLLAEARTRSDPQLQPEPFFDALVQNIKDLLEQNALSLKQVRGIGVGMPSFILFDTGYIVKTSNLVHIKDFPARSYLMDQLGHIPVVLDNDARVAALAEYRMGAGRGFKHILYCPVSTGVSSAMIIDGQVFRGAYGWAGESGHAIITPGKGLFCGCGNQGCIMSWCSGSMIVKHIQQWIEAGEPTMMTRLAGGSEHIDCFHLEAAFDQGDPMAIKALDQMAQYLGLWFFNLYVTLNINCFVLGGGLLKMGEKLLRPVRTIFDSYNRDEMAVYFKTAELGEQCGITGAAELIF